MTTMMESGIHHHGRPTEPRSSHTIRERDDWTNQVKLEPNLPSLAAGPCHKNWCGVTRSSQKLTWHDAISIISFLSFSLRHRAKKKGDISAHQNETLWRDKFLEGSTSPCATTLFVDNRGGWTSLIQIFNPQESWAVSWDFRHVKIIEIPTASAAQSHPSLLRIRKDASFGNQRSPHQTLRICKPTIIHPVHPKSS